MAANPAPALALEAVGKTFTMHLQGGLRLPVVHGVTVRVLPGECVVLGGPSGAGKSSLLKIAYGNYRCDEGHVLVREPDEIVDVATAEPRRIIRLRRTTIGYVSQFLRVIPRVPALDVVIQAAVEQGFVPDDAATRARTLLARLNVPERLWTLPPATFSGGEQQRVNIARGFVADHPILLLDEPTASLDARNRAAVVDLIREKKDRGVAILGIFHDEDVRDRVADRIVDVTRFASAA
ncbi:phosphonate C-P lyase system protein PhnL [uncultured Alsobacter sp.]|uniref:phosphonate C-P lyase system protein PhnL n=1 Tax=uncultured Alsobacter sp. TaxID=1748258 RepID=UPI0025F201D1|nr:phosphonate C-P lyase system protein PhnL [uncultured Alsobacter sp.]